MTTVHACSSRWSRVNRASALLAAALAAFASGAASAQRYQMTILQMPPEYRGVGQVYGINNAGDVVGEGG